VLADHSAHMQANAAACRITLADTAFVQSDRAAADVMGRQGSTPGAPTDDQNTYWCVTDQAVGVSLPGCMT